MKRLVLLFALFASAASAARADATINPPSTITRASYQGWLRAINSNVSAFTDNVFDWYETQLRTPLPAQVSADPDRIYVNVDKALQETIALEQSGDIEEGNTIGFDAYSIIDVPVQVALETKLFDWGKPVGAAQGDTYPFDSVFSTVHSRLEARWGAGNYVSTKTQTGGGIVQSLRDGYTILVRGDAAHGYVIYASFLAPAGDTATQAHMSVVMLRPTADGKTEYRQCVRQNGQSYKIFGIEYGRKNFGFNVSRDRQGEKQLNQMMLELKNTGTIRENRPGSLLVYY